MTAQVSKLRHQNEKMSKVREAALVSVTRFRNVPLAPRFTPFTCPQVNAHLDEKLKTFTAEVVRVPPPPRVQDLLVTSILQSEYFRDLTYVHAVCACGFWVMPTRARLGFLSGCLCVRMRARVPVARGFVLV